MATRSTSTGSSGERGERIAIVGMACIFPGAGDLETFRANLIAGRDAITDVPPDRWEPQFYDPDADDPARFYCRRGGFIDDFATFDALAWGVMPATVEGTEPDQLLALDLAARALADAGYAPDGSDLPRERTGVIFGRGGYINAGMTRLSQRVREAEQLVSNLRALFPGLDDATLSRVRREFREKVGHASPDTAIGVVSNLSASRIANRLDLQGPAYTIDAACASSLIAVERACADLRSGQADLVLAGGVHLTHDVSFWSVFTQLGALSHDQVIRPFDRRADGLLVGEGVGVIVLERLADAERLGRRVYAVIRGAGTASDGRGASLMVPRVEGQLLALRRAWDDAGLDPGAADAIGQIEAHGTATPAGDDAEMETLLRFFGPPPKKGPRAALGSVKSMIGHAMPAAGVAGLIKAALALHEKTLLPTLNCEEPRAELERSRFRVLSAAEPWERGSEPRRAGVNAFGFGGINAHVLLEEAPGDPASVVTAVTRPRPREADVLLLAASDPDALRRALDQGRRSRGPGGRRGGTPLLQGPCRLAVLAPTAKKLERARRAITGGRAVRGRGDIFFAPGGLLAGAEGKVAFLYPGVDQEFAPRINDVARAFGRPEIPALDPGDLGETGVGIVLVNQLLTDVLAELGVRPDMVAGHSIGEWSAMIAAGVIDPDAVMALIEGLEPGSLEVPGVAFAAAGCGLERAEAALAGLGPGVVGGELPYSDVVVSHDNCPHQVILCGQDAGIDEVVERLRGDGVLCQKLSFRSGFHSPFFADYVGAIRADFDRLGIEPPQLPMWSATTCEPYPSEPTAIRDLVVEHLVRPVRFRELLTSLHDAGARAFVQAGTGSLVGFVGDSLRGREHLVMGANVPRRSGMEQLQRLVAALWVEGAEGLDMERLFGADEGVGGDPPYDPRPEVGRPASGGRPMRLKLGAPLVRLDGPLDGVTIGASASPEARPNPVLAEFDAALAAVERGQRDVLEAWKQSGAPVAREPREEVFRRRLDLESASELWDHCFYRQPEDWPDVSDRFPVAPMTMSLAMLQQAARDLVPELVPIAIEEVRAFKWIAVEEPVDLEIEARWDGNELVTIRIRGYLEGKVRVAPAFPDAPAPSEGAPFEKEEPVPIDAGTLYADRWMFHGPAYRGVVGLGTMGSDGIAGTLEALEAEGGLLDCAGQLLGYWVMVHTEEDRLAMPIRLEAVRFYGSDPEPGERFDCRVRIRHLGARQVRADMELVTRGDGRLWARLEGWEDRRFDTDARSWPIVRFPERHLLAEPLGELPGLVWLPRGFRSRMSQDYFARRFLDATERAEYETRTDAQRADWLAGRIAAKDAVRHLLWQEAGDGIYPVEVAIRSEGSGRPLATCRHGGDLRVSIAHKQGVALAMAAVGTDVGVDLETIKLRGASFERIAFTEAERALLDACESPGVVGGLPPYSDDARAEQQARFWTAKEAVAKLRGTGLEGNPRRFAVAHIDGDELMVEGETVHTQRDGDWVLAWVRAGG